MKQTFTSSQTKPCWPNKKEEAGYQAEVNKLFYKDEVAIVDGFIKHVYEPIVESIKNGEIENPHVKGLAPQEVFIRWLDKSRTEQILYIGYHAALKDDNWDAFLCAQFAANRLDYQHNTRAYRQNWVPFDGPFGTGVGRSYFFVDALNALAACDVALVKHYLPKEEGLAKQGYLPFVVGANLLMCLMYNETEWLQPVLKQSKKIADNKSTTKSLSAVLRYLIALLEQDMAQANIHLQAAIDGFRKAGWLHDYRHPLSKFCPRLIYGLYFAAQFFLAHNQFTALIQPKHFLWRSDYVDFCAKNQFQPGKNTIPWSNELSFLHDEFDDLNRWKSFPSTQQLD